MKVYERSNLLLNHIQYTSDLSAPRVKRFSSWPYVLVIGFVAGFIAGCTIL